MPVNERVQLVSQLGYVIIFFKKKIGVIVVTAPVPQFCFPGYGFVCLE
jgi:hypothetical protein